MGDFAKGLAQFHTKGYFGKRIRMSLTLAVRLLDLVDRMKSEVPEENDEEYFEAMKWIEQEVCKRYSQAERAAWRAGHKK
ncbi:MAG TPA: hypothetical protein PLB89_05050 [Flavobacteriales bacterium]|nr:hypothetical protein [Flavobacteriales bacterium]